MKGKFIILLYWTTGLLLGVSLLNAADYSLMVPHTPRNAEKDHYGGAACVQIACPNAAAATQDNVYAMIQLHNSEPTLWFSNPKGIEKTLEDAVYSPCGNWSDFSNVNKNTVLGQLLYYMKISNYPAPVSVTDSEYWITVIGYQTDVEPTSTVLTVNLKYIYFYDPNPGDDQGLGMETGSVFMNNSDYWGVAYNNASSAWNGKFIAIIEPPILPFKAVVKEWLRVGRIWPINKIRRSTEQWLKSMKEVRMLPESLEVLRQRIKIQEPILVDAKSYSYYLVPFGDPHIAAIFNAYDGSFESLRYFENPKEYLANQNAVQLKLAKTLKKYNATAVKVGQPSSFYDAEATGRGRFSPITHVKTVIKDAKGRTHELLIMLDATGQVIKGLEQFEKAERIESVRPEKMPR